MPTLPNKLDLINSNLLGDDFYSSNGEVYSNARGHKLKEFFKKEKEKRKKIFKKLKDKVGSDGKKFRNKFRAVLRKSVLLSINKNIHGMAAKLYPAIASDADIKKRHYKSSYVSKSKKVYNDLIDRWKFIGGDENDMKIAISEGASKSFLKSPYKSFSGNNSDEFYNYTSYIERLMGADGTTDSGNMPSTPDTTPDSASPSVDEVPDAGETVKAKKGFFAWLAGLFKKHGAKENPYEEGTPNAATFDSQAKADAGNEPKPEEADNDAMKSVLDTSKTDDAGGKTDTEKGKDTKPDDTNSSTDTDGSDKDADKKSKSDTSDSGKIMGFDKKYVFIGAGVILLTIGTFVAIHMIKKGKAAKVVAKP